MKNIINLLGITIISSLIGCGMQKSTSQSNDTITVASEAEPHTHDDYFAAYDLEDEIFGTKTKVTISNGIRTMATNALPNHKTGEFPTKGNPNTISAQNNTYTFPVSPKFIGNPTWVREPGVALNGIKFEPGTAEVVVCDTGESYRVEAFQDLINLGLDFNHAHVQPTGAYHYHGTPTSVIEDFDTGEDLIHIGFAKDGFPIYFSKSEAYKPSYKMVDGSRDGEDCTYTNPMNSIDISVDDQHDGTYTSDFEFEEGSGDLDECNGISIDGKYMYLVTNTFPYVSRCLMGEVTQQERQGPGEGQRPSVADIMEHMDADKDGRLSEAEVKGPLMERFNIIDVNEDGYVTREELEKNQKNREGPGQRKPRSRN